MTNDKYFLILALCFLLLALTACPGIPKLGSYPTGINFQQAEKDFLGANYQSALHHYETFSNVNPSSPYRVYARYKMGVCYLKLGKYNKALDTLSRALKERPYPSLKAQIFSGLAQGYLYKKQYPSAARYYKKALAINENVSHRDEDLFYLATALMRSGKWQEGCDYFSRLIEKYPESNYAEAAKERLFLPPDTFIVQLGKYRERENAQATIKELRKNKEINASLQIMLINGEQFYFVWAGSFSRLSEAFGRAEEIRAKGVEAMVVP